MIRQRFLRKLKKDQNGSVLVIVALFMTVMLGMSALVLDLGIAYNESSNLQKTLDSTALAAVRELPINVTSEWESKVEKVAKDYAQLNEIGNVDDLIFYPVGIDGIPFDSGAITSSNLKNIRGIKVVGETNVEYNFARIFGVNNKIITKDSQAELLTVMGKDKIIPFALSSDSFKIIKEGNSDTQPIYFDSNHTTETGGWFGILNVDDDSDYTDSELKQYGSNWKAYQIAMVNGSKNSVSIGQIIDMETGSQGNLVDNAYDKRIEGHEYCEFIGSKVIKYDKFGISLGECINCPRLVTVPIIMEKSALLNITSEELDLYDLTMEDVNSMIEVYDESNNKKQVFVLALATVFLDDLIKTSGNKYQLVAKYVNQDIVGGNAIAGPVYNDYGVRAAKLVD